MFLCFLYCYKYTHRRLYYFVRFNLSHSIRSCCFLLDFVSLLFVHISGDFFHLFAFLLLICCVIIIFHYVCFDCLLCLLIRHRLDSIDIKNILLYCLPHSKLQKLNNDVKKIDKLQRQYTQNQERQFWITNLAIFSEQRKYGFLSVFRFSIPFAWFKIFFPNRKYVSSRWRHIKTTKFYLTALHTTHRFSLMQRIPFL